MAWRRDALRGKRREKNAGTSLAETRLPPVSASANAWADGQRSAGTFSSAREIAWAM